MSELKYETLGDMMPFYPRSTLVIRKQFVDAAIDELKDENERLNKELTEWIQSAANRPIVISKIRNELRETKRALWLARAERAMAESYSVLNDVPTSNRWVKALNKLKAKAEAYK